LLTYPPHPPSLILVNSFFFLFPVACLVQVQVLSDYSATPPMAAPGSGLTATGLAVTVIAVSVGVSSTGGFALLLSFAGVLAGASLIFVGVQVADDDPTAPIGRPGVQP